MQEQLLPHQYEVAALIEAKQWVTLRDKLRDWPVPEVADLLRDLPKRDRVLLYRALPRDLAAETFAHLDMGAQDALARDLTDAEMRRLLADLTPDDRTHLLEELPGAVTQRLLNLLGPADREETRSLLGYPEETVGRLMTPDYVALRPEWTVEQALAHLRTHGMDRETINRLYVVDGRWHLLDDIPLRRLILARPDQTVEELMDHVFVALSAFQDREEAVLQIRRYDVVALPVVDSTGVLLGIVTVDDLLDVAVDEATEDFHKAASIGPILTSLREATVWVLFQRRIGWLLILVLMNVFSGAGIAFFEDTIAATVALVFFLPLLIDSAGNAGSQAATLMVRALATGDVTSRDWLAMLFKEIRVAFSLAVTMAAAVTLVALYRGGFDLAVVVASTMTLVVIVGSVIGMSLPFLLERLKLDPATASAPLVTSIADISGVLIYFGIATWYLGV